MAALVTIFFILHFAVGLILPLRPGFKPYYYMWIRQAGVDFEKRLNRTQTRSEKDLRTRGIAVGIAMIVFAVVTGLAVKLAGHFSFGIVVQMLFIMCCVNFMTPLKTTRQVLKDVPDNLPHAIALLQPYTREPLGAADAHAVLRKAIEFIAVSVNRFLLGPVFWLLIAGPIGMSMYVTFSALSRAFGLPDPRRKNFGLFVRAVDILMNIVSAALSAIFLAVGALFVSRSNPIRAVKTILRQGRVFGFYYEGWLLAAVAGGLGVTLGGPVRYTEDYAENLPWVGPADSTARLQPADLNRAMLLQYVFFVCTLLLVTCLMIFGK